MVESLNAPPKGVFTMIFAVNNIKIQKGLAVSVSDLFQVSAS